MLSTWVLASSLMLISAPETGPVTLARDGATDWAILIAPGSSASMRHGADELADHLKKMTGADFPVREADVEAAAWPEGLDGAIVIRDDARAARSENREPLGPEAFRVRTITNGGLPRVEITGDARRGALYGCYSLLEDDLGVRWFTSTITRIPSKPTLTLAAIDRTERPAFEYREPFWTEAFDGPWAARNRTNGNSQRLDEKMGGRVRYGAFVHTFNDLVPPDTYFDAHPEYFSLIDGARKKGYYQLCLTNPDVLRISIERVREWIKANPDATIFSVSQNDTGFACQCENCKAVEAEEGAPSGVVLRFVNAVAEAIGKDHPDVLIDTLAYQWTEAPPRLVRPRPNVRIRLAPIGACVAHAMDRCDANATPLANLDAWSKITHQLYVWHYCTNFANYLQPLPDLDSIIGTTRAFHGRGVVGLFYQGAYAPGGGGFMAELKAYLEAKLMWDPGRDADAIVADYLAGVYGPAASRMRGWIDRLHRPARESNVHAKIYDPPTAAYLSDETLAAGSALFDAAEAAARGDATALDQVRRARLSLEYVQLARAKEGPERERLADSVAAKIRAYGITQVREGEPVGKYLERIGRAAP
jgi:hypothetical protein